MKYCSDAVSDFKLPDEHCDSCHEDANSGLADMCHIWINNNPEYEVCCVVSQNYEKHTTQSKVGASHE